MLLPDGSDRSSSQLIPKIVDGALQTSTSDHEQPRRDIKGRAICGSCKGVIRAHLLCAFEAQSIGGVVGARWDKFELYASTSR